MIRPHQQGLMLQTLYYAEEVRSFAEIGRGVEEPVKDAELKLAKRLIDDLAVKKFDPSKYHDGYRERVEAAARRRRSAGERRRSATKH